MRVSYSLQRRKRTAGCAFYAYYIRSVIYMYQSKLQEATECAGVAKNIATEGGMEQWISLKRAGRNTGEDGRLE